MTETTETLEIAPLPRYVMFLSRIRQRRRLNAHSTATRGEMVAVFIGPDKIRHDIHKDLICHHSDYFRRVYNGSWKEVHEGVTLPDVEPEIFNIFVNWLYSQVVPSERADILRVSETPLPKDHGIYPVCKFLILKATVLGDYLMAVRLKRQAHNVFVDLCHGCGPMYEHVNYAFGNLPQDDLPLDLLVEHQCCNWIPEMDAGNEKERYQLLNTFLVRLMRKNFELNCEDDPRE